MKLMFPLALAALIAVSGCSGDDGKRWYENSEVTSLEPDGGYDPIEVDTRPLVAQITALRLEVTPGGIVVRATGLPPLQEYWDADLVLIDSDNVPASTLRYEFRVRPPVDSAIVGTVASREIILGAYASELELRGIREITVVGATNSRTVRR